MPVVSLMMLNSSALAQIPNNDFENWAELSAEQPNHWSFVMSATKSTDKHSGAFAVRLQGDTAADAPGVVLNGASEDGIEFTGGEPFAARPDSFYFWARYNIAPGDSALVYLQLKKAGVPVSVQWYRITGASAVYRKLSFKISYQSGAMPDSIIMAVVSTNPFEDPNYESWIMVDDIGFYGTSQNLKGSGFEDWNVLKHYMPEKWAPDYDVFDLMTRTKPSVLRSFVAATGGACIHVRNAKQQDGQLRPGETRTMKNPEDPGYWGPAFPVTGRPDSLFCQYKWLPREGDACLIGVTMWKNGKLVGSGNFSTTDTQANWKIAAIPITYLSADVPDSSQIALYSYTFGARGESDLYVDNLNFNRIFGVSVKRPFTVDFRIFPNPVSDRFSVSFPAGILNTLVRVYDASGREVLVAPVSGNSNTVEVSVLPPGMYSVEVDGCFGRRKLLKD